jgi:hypothetical protein
MATFLLALLSLNLVTHDLESFRRAASEAKPGATRRGECTHPTECSPRAAHQQSAN